MKFRKDYSYVIAFYSLVILYVLLIGNKWVTSLLVVALFCITIYIYTNVKGAVEKEKDDSVSTLLHRLDKSKKESKETYMRFLSLSKTLGSGVFMVDEEGVITFNNLDIKNFFGLDLNNKEYKVLEEIKPLYNFVNESYLLEDHLQRQIKYKNKYYDLINTPLFEGDMFAGSIVLVHDITQIKTAEKYQKRFTSDVSHELRTPLSAIKGFSEIMLRDENMSKENRLEFIGLINKESERMETIINDLMIISRLDRIDYELNLNKLDIKSVIEESVSLLDSKYKDKGLDKIMQVESCVFEFDKVKISQVVINIVKNAINYTDNGFVKVKGYREEERYILKISDSGIGINKKNQDKIFTRFYRVDKARSRDTGGSGLGLSISKNVIIKHGGKIDVKSKTDEGSEFTITLPIKE